jgi:hypothetical protein
VLIATEARAVTVLQPMCDPSLNINAKFALTDIDREETTATISLGSTNKLLRSIGLALKK